MKKFWTILIAYFPLAFLTLQVIADMVYLFSFNTYASAYFYLGWSMGGSFLVSLLLIALTERLKFCGVSKWSARAQMGFSIVYFIIRQDNIYNISIQIVIGLVAIAMTAHYYKHKFPLCRLSLLLHFFKHIFREGNCEKGIARYDQEIKTLLRKSNLRHENSGNYP